MNRRRCTAGLVLLFIGASDRLPQTSWAQAPSISGEVYDSLQGRPLQGATVQLASANDSARGRTWAATTDSAGRYRIADVPA
ncbi:MAG TPA: carboxypeptidase-like regulatory domain-containing protein, partial [Gemmatimonadaceae bacterium]|nr:carboxypeptidase-like regulatory domain-containing protein [Gemmatimonadaceae bacterium]